MTVPLIAAAVLLLVNIVSLALFSWFLDRQLKGIVQLTDSFAEMVGEAIDQHERKD